MKCFSILAVALLAAGPALSADLLSVYRDATLQDAVYASAKAQYIAAQERLPQILHGPAPDVVQVPDEHLDDAGHRDREQGAQDAG